MFHQVSSGSLRILIPSNDTGLFNLQVDGVTQAANVGDGGNTGYQVFPSGTIHSVGETAGNGTSLTNYASGIECRDDGTNAVVGSGSGTSLSNITVNANQSITCTITNTRNQGKLEVIKDLIPSADTGKFNLQIDGTTEAPNVGDGGTTGEKTVTPGNHTVGETAGTGTSLSDYTSSIECKGNNGAGAVVASGSGAGPLTVPVASNDDIVCIVTNTKSATVTITKVTDPASDPEDFGFTNSGNGLDATATLDTDAGSAGTPSSVTYTLDASELAGTKTIQEDAETGWSLTTVDCAGVTQTPISRGASFTVAAGDSINCTFTNVKDATVTITKVTDPASDPEDFGFTNSGNGLDATATLDTDAGSAGTPSSVTYTLDASELAGTKTIQEDAETGWSLTTVDCAGVTETPISRGASFTVAAGDSINCTFTNVKDATVTITKVTDPASDPEDFGFTNSGNGLDATATLDTDAGSAGTPSSVTYTLDASELAGTKTIQEDAETGWSLTTVDCAGVTETPISRGASFTVAAGDSINCTFTNVKGASLTVIKNTTGGDDTFDFDGSGSNVPADIDITTVSGTGTHGPITFDSTQLGEKQITETSLASWTLTDIGCDSGTFTIGVAGNAGSFDTAFDAGDNSVKVTIAAGNNVTCTFTNVKDATVTITKVTDPASDPEDFGFTNSGNGLDATATLDTDAGSAGTPSSVTYTLDASELAGTKTIQEDAETGWSLTTVDCAGVTETPISRGASFTVAAGDSINCTFTNVKDATVTITKVTDPASDPEDFGFTNSGNGLDATATLDTDAGSAGTPSSVTYTLDASELAGTKTIQEDAETGWSLTTVDCAGVTETPISRGASFRAARTGSDRLRGGE